MSNFNLVKPLSGLALELSYLEWKFRFRKAMLYPTELRDRVISNLLRLEHRFSVCVSLISFNFLKFPTFSRAESGENMGKNLRPFKTQSSINQQRAGA